MGKLRFALQLYTVRDHLDKNVPETLHDVKAAGYDFVELGGTPPNTTPQEFKSMLNDAGLKPISTHIGYQQATQDVSEGIELAQFYQVKYVVVGGIDPKLTPDKAGWAACGRALSEGGGRLVDAGIHLCYHNHAHEFQRIEGEFPFDVLLGAADPANLSGQIDTFWVQYANIDPVTVIEKYSGRCPLLHVKDMADARSRAFAEVGRGIMDWNAIFRAAVAAGTKWYIVEQDTCARDSIDSVRISAAFMSEQ
jgi:sugar phosphate isomerase/epimerase